MAKTLLVPFLNSHHVRQGNACLLTFLICVLVPGQVQVNVHLQDTEAVIVDSRHALLFSFLLLNVVQLMGWLAQVHITVEPSFLQLQNSFSVLRITCVTRSADSRLRAVRHNNVFGGNKHRNLTTFAWVVVHLLER
jgi:hypothetical protein